MMDATDDASTERRDARARLREHAERFRTDVAGTIAHDIDLIVAHSDRAECLDSVIDTLSARLHNLEAGELEPDTLDAEDRKKYRDILRGIRQQIEDKRIDPAPFEPDAAIAALGVIVKHSLDADERARDHATVNKAQGDQSKAPVAMPLVVVAPDDQVSLIVTAIRDLPIDAPHGILVLPKTAAEHIVAINVTGDLPWVTL